MPKPSAPQPPTPEWIESEYLVENEFDRIAGRRIELKLQQDEIERELKDLNLECGAMLATAGVTSVRFGHHRLTLGYSSKGGKLSKERLLELGVTTEQLEQATSPKEQGNPYISVTEIKSQDQE